jgi:hypothetical protein
MGGYGIHFCIALSWKASLLSIGVDKVVLWDGLYVFTAWWDRR